MGVLTAIADTAVLKWLGTSFAMNGRDVTTLIAGWFGVSFAVLGFLLGGVIDGRRRERRASETILAQMKAIESSRARLLQNEKLAALGQLAAAIAHEVRNPLAVIRSAAQNLGDTLPGDNAESRRACSFITEETDRLGNLINSLLAFARSVQIAPVRVPIADLFGRAFDMSARERSAKQVIVRRPQGDQLGTITVDPDLIGQVLTGLLANAIAAAPAGGEVVLETCRQGRDIVLAVADSGPGVPPELRSRVFEPFFTTRAEGVGLGLAIARQIVEAHNGRIEVGVSRSGGARFAVVLPEAEPAAAST